MGSEIPEWAMEAADEVWTSLANNEANGRDAETALIARALVAAERRGIERAAIAADATEDVVLAVEAIRQLGDTP